MTNLSIRSSESPRTCPLDVSHTIPIYSEARLSPRIRLTPFQKPATPHSDTILESERERERRVRDLASFEDRKNATEPGMHYAAFFLPAVCQSSRATCSSAGDEQYSFEF